MTRHTKVGSYTNVAPTEMAGEARPNKPALLNRQRMSVRKGLVDDTMVHLTVYIPFDGRYTLDP